MLPAAALLGAGVAITAGVAAGQPDDSSSQFGAQLAAATARADAHSAAARAQLDAGRAVRTSRSDQRTTVDRTKATRLTQENRSGGQATHTQDLTSQDPRTVARALMPQFGFGSDQFSCLDALWNRESGWNVHAANPTSSAYGIPQALPGSKMASAGADWASNPATQIKWGLGYIKGSYGSPCGAWGHSESYGWY
ncbi:MAG: hypothetical protein QOK15_1053 [Nocardioidaceae bacterium]|nr:hypothetical protein [Nocardioidaceae bacterium]